jgi:macrolide transport system ATP-binding/permease protein
MLPIMRRLRSFFRRGHLDDELAEEIRLHLELRQRALIEGGMAPADADREARRQFGNIMSIRERTRDQWGSVAVAAFLQDVRFGARMLARSPGLSVVIVLTIAFGSFLNGAVFLQLNDTFLRAPDLPNAKTLVWLDDGGPRTGGTTYPDYVDYRDRVPAIDLAVFAGGGNTNRVAVGSTVAAGADARPVSVVLATGNYFRVLQAGAALGRTFDPSEDRPPLGTPVAVVSDAYWQRQLGRDSDVVGRTVQLNFKPFTIVGVMPPNFSGARQPGGRAYTPDIWVPMWCHPRLEPGSKLLQGRTSWWGLQSIGRLRDGVGIPQARAEVKAVAAALDTEYPGQRNARAPRVWRVTDFDPGVLRGQEAIMLGIAGAATLLVMLIACGNVASLLLARAAARRQEVAIRLSLGASRVRIVRQFLTEGLVLSIAGTGFGFIVAGWASGLASAGGGASTAIDGRIVAYAAFLAVVATLSAGLMPAIQASRTELHPDLTRTATSRVGRLRTSLVGVEVAISLVLLLTAALLLRGVARASLVDPGMPVDNLLAISMDANRHGYEGPRLDAIVREARRHLEGLPGVRSTAVVNPAPFSGARSATGARRGDAPDSPAVSTFLAAVSPDFPDVVDLQTARGRWFSGTADEEVVINESLASRLWAGGDPLGQRLTTGEFDRRSHLVVGVVRDAPYAELRHQHEPFLFRPGRTGTIMVRTSGPAAAVARSATAAVKQLDARLVVTAALPAERIAQERTAGRRTIVAVAGIGTLALLIALGGVAAIASHSVALRTREIGIRIALGARRADAVSLIVRLALAPVAIGAIAGLAIASLGSRVLVRQLYGISPLDPVSFTGTAVFLMLAAAAAAWLPARRAAGVDPILVLRSE